MLEPIENCTISIGQLHQIWKCLVEGEGLLDQVSAAVKLDPRVVKAVVHWIVEAQLQAEQLEQLSAEVSYAQRILDEERDPKLLPALAKHTSAIVSAARAVSRLRVAQGHAADIIRVLNDIDPIVAFKVKTEFVGSSDVSSI